ncbi:hypothetical protein GIB67_002468 [Kingdonia uniflora]|uniref:C3H1-type domain-containing protein n=1 Tax=Kingdonia uniflora TaxID=39325 RepID=A0A7J7LAM8_9MAGN|nr:hypothetical protein GIB67_002468 [Kingdonia uniflora]
MLMNQNPAVNLTPWSLLDESTDGMIFPLPVSGISSNINHTAGAGIGGEYSPFLLADALSALQRYIPSNDIESESDIICREADIAVDAYSCDEFRMYEFKVRRCARGRSHDWTECPYAHPGEKARRRDPRKFHYSGTACPDFRKGNCKRGDSCEFAHGVFECWLHPARYRTQPCKDGTSCRRRVCFFAHTPDQLRLAPQLSPRSHSHLLSESPPSYDGSPLRHAFDSYFAKGSPNSTMFSPPGSPPSDSPPVSPSPLSRSLGSGSINEMVANLRHLQLNKVKSAPPCVQIGSVSGFGSPRGGSSLRPMFSSLPNTPTRTQAQTPTRTGLGLLDLFGSVQEEPQSPMDRVESIRPSFYDRLGSLDQFDSFDSPAPTPVPDVGWVSELVK